MEIIQLNIQGMTCAACVSHVEKGIKKTEGIDIASVNLATEKATISYDPQITSVDEIVRSVFDAGYGATLPSEKEKGKEQEQKDRELKKLRLQTFISALLSAPLLLGMVTMFIEIPALMFLHNPLFQLILATPVQFWIGWR